LKLCSWKVIEIKSLLFGNELLNTLIFKTRVFKVDGEFLLVFKYGKALKIWGLFEDNG